MGVLWSKSLATSDAWEGTLKSSKTKTTKPNTMARSETIPVLTSEMAIEILTKTLEELQSPQNTKKLEEARDNIYDFDGNVMLKMMKQYCVLHQIVMQVETDVIKDFGFPSDGYGIMIFTNMLSDVEREDPEVARLIALIKTYYVRPVSVNASNEFFSVEDREDFCLWSS